MVMGFLVLWSISSSTSKMVPRILQGGQPRSLSLWFYFCYIVWFPVVFSFSRETLFKFFFLSSPLVWWCPLPIFPSTCKFPFLWFFSRFGNSIPCRFLLLIICMAHFSIPNSIPISWLYILTVYVRTFNYFFIFDSLMSSMYIRWLIFSCNLVSL